MMRYKEFKELNISMLGMGNMRLPTVGKNGPIDEKKARGILEYAYEHGVNYFDTAYRYHDGASEPFVGEVMKQYPRESWLLASKMPGHMMKYENRKLGFLGYLQGNSMTSPDEIFEDQLERCKVDYFDFYLLHNLCETSYGFYTDKDLKIVEYLLRQKQAGRIKHFGFSAHGRTETIEKFLNEYDCFEFAQIQLNYLDWVLQEASKKYKLLTDRHLPIIAMEPVRGGTLAALPSQAETMLKQARPKDSIASWAFRFLQSLENVQVVLSGMTTLEQLKENIELFSKDDPTTGEENELLQTAISSMLDLVPCTACRYCCEECPQSLDIPKLIAIYNEAVNKPSGLLNFTVGGMGESELPSACIACKACSQLCPQGIDIPTILEKLDETLAKLK